MTAAALTRDIADGIARDRPDLGNALTSDAAKELTRAIDTMEARPDIRVVVLSHNGPMFCAGGDIREFAAVGDGIATLIGDELVALNGALMKLAALPCPVIASVHGAVAGGGIGLALAADVVIAAASVRFRAGYGRRKWKFGHEENGFGNLVLREICLTVVDHVGLVRDRSIFQTHDGGNGFEPVRVWEPDRRCRRNRRVSQQRAFHDDRCDVLAAALDHVFLAIRKYQMAAGIEMSDVARVMPTELARFGRIFGFAKIAGRSISRTWYAVRCSATTYPASTRLTSRSPKRSAAEPWHRCASIRSQRGWLRCFSIIRS